MNPSIVLLRRARTTQGSDPYEDALSALSRSVQSVPVLGFDIAPPPTLTVLLARASTYRGLICTSPRAVQALEQALPPSHPQYTQWTPKPVYVVGRRTAQAVARWGGTPHAADSRQCCGTG